MYACHCERNLSSPALDEEMLSRSYDREIIECTPTHPTWQKGGGAEKKNMGLGARFQKRRVEPYYQWGLNSKRGRGGLTSQRGPDSQGLPCFHANVFSVATLLLIIHITMYILISLK